MNPNTSIPNDESTFKDFELQSLISGMTLCEKYRLESKVGEDGMGVVWKAWDSIGERWVALKFLPPEIRHLEGAVAQVKAAFKKIQVLNHTNICRVHGLEKDSCFGYFIVMEWLDALPLNEIELSKAQIPAILEKVADALDYAHSEKVFHRDVKPSNIFVSENGKVWLNDFEIAAEIQLSISMNTTSTVCRTIGMRPYMAPELWRGQPQDESTDQYALGVVAYQLYAGHLPFQNPDVSLFRMTVLDDIPESLENVSTSVNAAVQRALAKDRKNRFASCREFVDVLAGTTFPASSDPFEAFFMAEKAEEEARRQQLPKLALDAYQADKYTEAAEYLREYLKYDPENGNAKQLLSRCETSLKKDEVPVTEWMTVAADDQSRFQSDDAANDSESVISLGNDSVFQSVDAESVTLLENNSVFQSIDDESDTLLESNPLFQMNDSESVFSTENDSQIHWDDSESIFSPENDSQVQSSKPESVIPAENQLRFQFDDAGNIIPAGTRKVLTASGIDYAFRWCPPGEFIMGSPMNESGRYEDETQHKVKLTQGFWCLETEVTVEMFKSFVESTNYRSRGYMPYGWTGTKWEQSTKYSWRNPGFSQNSKHPVTCVSWDDAQAFCRWLSKQINHLVQLPTEAQWEYACRAEQNGIVQKLDEMGWFSSNSSTRPHMVGLKKPNAWGLYDMRGNVWEWCLDWYDDEYYTKSPMNDPSGPEKTLHRVGRGGSWNAYGRDCRSASRGRDYPEVRSNSLGLRVLVIPNPEN